MSPNDDEHQQVARDTEDEEERVYEGNGDKHVDGRLGHRRGRRNDVRLDHRLIGGVRQVGDIPRGRRGQVRVGGVGAEVESESKQNARHVAEC